MRYGTEYNTDIGSSALAAGAVVKRPLKSAQVGPLEEGALITLSQDSGLRLPVAWTDRWGIVHYVLRYFRK